MTYYTPNGFLGREKNILKIGAIELRSSNCKINKIILTTERSIDERVLEAGNFSCDRNQ